MSGDTLNVYSEDASILVLYKKRYMTLTVGLLDYPDVTPISQNFIVYVTSTCDVASIDVRTTQFMDDIVISTFDSPIDRNWETFWNLWEPTSSNNCHYDGYDLTWSWVKDGVAYTADPALFIIDNTSTSLRIESLPGA